MLALYRQRVEAWVGKPDPEFYGTGGVMHVQQVNDPDAFSLTMLAAANAVGIPRFENSGGQMMRAPSGCAVVDNIMRDGKRQSVYRSYVHPRRGQANVTVLTRAPTTRLLFDGARAVGVGVEFEHEGRLRRARAGVEVVVSQGAMRTPKLLMQSGIGLQEELSRFGIAVRQNLPGVGRNLNDHDSLNLVFEGTAAPLPAEVRSAMVAFWRTTPALDAPNFYTYAIGVPFLTPENAAKYPPPQSAWTFVMGMRPASRGTVRLTGAKASDPLLIHTNNLSEPEDLGNLVLGVERAREIGNAAPLRDFTKGELAAGKLTGAALEDYIRNGLGTFWHQSCTAKMGRDERSVVDSKLKVHGIEGLRIADASVLPRVTTGNTMAPCVIVGEMAAAMLQDQYRV